MILKFSVIRSFVFWLMVAAFVATAIVVQYRDFPDYLELLPVLLVVSFWMIGEFLRLFLKTAQRSPSPESLLLTGVFGMGVVAYADLTMVTEFSRGQSFSGFYFAILGLGIAVFSVSLRKLASKGSGRPTRPSS